LRSRARARGEVGRRRGGRRTSTTRN